MHREAVFYMRRLSLCILHSLNELNVLTHAPGQSTATGKATMKMLTKIADSQCV